MKKYALIILIAALALSSCIIDPSAEKADPFAVEVDDYEDDDAYEDDYDEYEYEDYYDEYEDDEEDSDDEYVYHGHTPLSDYADDSDYLDEFDMYYVESTCFDEIGYNYYDETLYLRFLDSQKEYLYLDVPEYVFDELYDSDAPGRYYNQEIKGQYECERLFD